MKKQLLIVPIVFLAISAGSLSRLNAQAKHGQDSDRGFRFIPGTLVITRSVYEGKASTVVNGESLPFGCQGGLTGLTVNVPTTTGGTTPVTVPCGVASDNGEYPNLHDTHNVWNNANSDPSFGVTSPIFLDDITPDGWTLGTLSVPTDKIVTSFSSKSELALNRSVDGRSLTFMGYRGGVGCGGSAVSPTEPNLLDVSQSNTPGVCDPTNPVISTFSSNPVVPTAYYRAVAEVDADGRIGYTDGNAYSGDNGRAAIKGHGLYYTVGNDNSGNLSKKQVTTTIAGEELVQTNGVELLVPGATAPVPPNIAKIGDFEINQVIEPSTGLPYALDKAGKDDNFRGITIFHDTLYVTKGSGGNGINTVYQVGAAGTLPSGDVTTLAAVPITILPGLPHTLASGVSSTGAATPVAFPFGIWFANDETLYICDEGDGTLVSPAVNGNVADAASLATAGIQKWSLVNGSWQMDYVLQDGLQIGIPYSVPNYPADLSPATGGCRGLTGRVGDDGVVALYAVTSTLSTSGDQGADPNRLVEVSDRLDAKTLPSGGKGWFGHFVTLRAAKAGEVFRGVAFAPEGDHDDGHGDNDRE